MAMPYLARRSVLSLMVLLCVLAGLAAPLPAGAGAHLAALKPAKSQPGKFTLFESGQVRPLALSPSGKFLFAANTPDDRLEVFRIDNHGLKHQASIPVGLEPVAVAARSNTEVWVTNHLSDSVSIVDLNTRNVVNSLNTGDEPADVIFAGSPQRAFVSVLPG